MYELFVTLQKALAKYIKENAKEGQCSPVAGPSNLELLGDLI